MFEVTVLAMSGKGDDEGVGNRSAGFYRNQDASFWNLRGRDQGKKIPRGGRGQQQNPPSDRVIGLAQLSADNKLRPGM